MATQIHPQAIVEPGAKLGEDVQIGPFAYVGAEVSIGDRTVIGQGARIEGETTIGQDCEIFSHAVVGSIPQDLKFHGEKVQLIIGDRNKIREFTLINPGTEGGGGVTRIGDDNLFMGYVHVAHDCLIGNRCIFANAATLAGHVEIGDGVVVGESGCAALLPGRREPGGTARLKPDRVETGFAQRGH